MVKTITPFSTRAKEGATDSPLGDFVSVDQQITSTANAGFYDANTGKLTGIKASDRDFGIMQTDVGIANGADFTSPSTNADGTWPLNMSGYTDLLIAIKPSNGGNYAMTGVMATDSVPFYNLSPTNAGQALRGVKAAESGSGTVNNILYDAAESLNVDVWNIFILQSIMRQQPNLAFKFTNNSGGISTIETAFMRLV